MSKRLMKKLGSAAKRKRLNDVEKALEEAGQSLNSGAAIAAQMKRAYDKGAKAEVGDLHNSIVPACFEGVRFRSSADKEKCAKQVSTAYFHEISLISGEELRRREEREKQLHTEIHRLRDALELEQRRHFSDITAFANGGSRYDDEPKTAERRY